MSQRRILVVEDESAIRDMVSFNLGRAGYDVSSAADAREATRQFLALYGAHTGR